MGVKASIIIISYNEVEYLRSCFESCLALNKNNDIEIIIGDDGSLDGSVELIKEFEKSNPLIVKHFVNERDDGVFIPSIRVSNTIKKAMSMAKGEYCVCISGDDLFLDDNYLSIAVDFLDSDTKREYSAVVTNNYKYFWNNGKEKDIYVKKCYPKIYWAGMYIHISCFVFRKDFVCGHLLERFCDDTGLEYVLACCGKWKYIDNCVFGYRQRDESIMHSNDEMSLMILELLLFQDCLNYKKKLLSSFSRFYYPLNYIKHNKKDLSFERYKKYFDNADKYKFNILICVQNRPNIFSMLVIFASIIRNIYMIILKLI